MKSNIFRIVNAANETAPTELHLSGGVGDSWDGITARQVIDAVQAAKPVALRIMINSGGGDAFMGVEIGRFLKSQTIPVEAVVTGLCASAATVIALGAKKISMAAGSLFMIHNPSGGQWGEAKDMRKTADVLDKLAGELSEIYAAKTGKPVADMLALMDAETWMTGKEALAAGFIDAVEDVPANIAAYAFAGTKFKNAPKNVQLLVDPLAFIAKSLHCEPTAAAVLTELEGIQKGQEDAAERIAGLTGDIGKVSASLGAAEGEIKLLKDANDSLTKQLAANPDPDAAAAKIVASMAILPVSQEEATGPTVANDEATPEAVHAKYKAIKDPSARFAFFQKHSETLLKFLR